MGKIPTPDANESDEKPIDLRRHLGVVRARFWIILLCTVVVLSFYTVRVFRQPPTYRAEARVLIERSVPTVGPFADPAAASESYYNYQTAIKLITCREVMERALYRQDEGGEFLLDEKGRRVFTDFGKQFASPKVKHLSVKRESLLKQVLDRIRGVFQYKKTRDLEPWERLRGRVRVVPDPASNIVGIRVSGGDSKQVAQIANAVAEAFVAFGRSLRERGDVKTYRELARQLKDQRGKLEAAQQALRDFRDEVGIVELNLAAADTAVMQEFQRLKQEYAQVQRRRKTMAEAMALAERLQREGKDPEALLAVPAIRERPDVTSLQQRLVDTDIEMQLASKTLGPKHTRIIALREQLKTLRNQLHAALLKAVRSLADEYTMVVASERALKAEYDREAARVEKLGKISDRYRQLQSDVELEKKAFDTIREQLKSIDIRMAAEPVTNIKLIEEAAEPRSPVGPDKRRAVFVGILLGLALGLVAAYILEYLDDTVKTPDDLENRLHLAPLGHLPDIQTVADGREGFIELATHTLVFPLSSTTEAFRAVRTNIYFSGERGHMKSLLVTSAAPGDGKTSFAANLAITVAQDRRRVLVVDADLRRPMLHHAFGLEREPGLSNVLAEGVPFEEAVQRMPETESGSLDNLHLLPAGSQSPNPAELIGGESMAALMAHVREAYDLVIYDSCPILLVADAALLAAGCDGVVLITKVGRSRREAVRRARRQLEAVGAKIIGAVLNGVGPKALRGHRYGYYYGYGYGYGYTSGYDGYYREEKQVKKPRSAGTGS